MSSTKSVIDLERQRIEAEYQRRAREISPDLYAPWQPAEIFMCAERKRVAARMLHRAGVFPKSGDLCLEVGVGSLGWLADLLSWGVQEIDLHGIDLDATRVKRAKGILPMADLRVGDATNLPWDNDTFQLIIASTVFTSILSDKVRLKVAAEIKRVLRPGGAVLWYDFAINNPRNPHVRKVNRQQLASFFPELIMQVQSVTPAPPLARFVAPRSWTLITLLAAIPLVRTHLLGVLVKSNQELKVTPNVHLRSS